MLNIGGDASDASYRYKMPRLLTKVEGRGNGIKTVITNMTDIAKALKVDPGYPTKFFGIELGAQSKFNRATERAIVNGNHDAPDLQKHLERFIEIFVLCPTCKLPETTMSVRKGAIKIDCAACGHNGALQTSHKLSTYILKEAAESGKKTDGKKEKKKKDKGADVAEEKPKKKEKNEDVEGEEDKEDDAPKKEAEVEWFTDTSKEAQKRRKEQEFAEMKAHADYLANVDQILNTASGDKDNPAVVLKVFMAQSNRTLDEIQSEVRRLQLARGFDEPKKIKVVLDALIDLSDPKSVPDQYKKHSKLLRMFAPDKSSASLLLSVIEEQVGLVDRRLLPRVPFILQGLYENDVLDEDIIMSWYEAPPESSWLVNKDISAEVKNKAQPFVKWLKEADEED